MEILDDFPKRGFTPRRNPPEIANRLSAKTVSIGTCCVWQGGTDKNGYGIISIDGHPNRVHRVQWQLDKGPIPEGMWVLHTCDNPPCRNIDHLYLGTVVENNRDKRIRKRSAKAQWTHCAAGHEFTPENTHIRPNGCRSCKECVRRYAREAYHRNHPKL